MASNKKEAAGLGYKLLAILITLVVIAGVFAVAFSEKGNQTTAIINAAIPVVSGWIVAMLLGSISKLRHKRWTIYLFVLIAVAIFVVLRLFRVF